MRSQRDPKSHSSKMDAIGKAESLSAFPAMMNRMIGGKVRLSGILPNHVSEVSAGHHSPEVACSNQIQRMSTLHLNPDISGLATRFLVRYGASNNGDRKSRN